MKLVELLDEAVQRARDVVAEKNPELDAEATREEVARAVGIGAVKYADLSSDRIKDYVFDWDRMLAFEGNTAPYLQYAHARIRSIFRQRGRGRAPAGLHHRRGPRRARPRARDPRLRRRGPRGRPTRSSRTASARTSSTLSTAFSTFYEQCPVLKAASEEERRSRLALSDLTARVIARGLDLLGIEAPDRM